MTKQILLYFLGLLTVACQYPPLPNSSIVINQNWEFSQSGEEAWYSAKVPGTVHTDLLDNDLIEDPYWENNELKLQWVEDENWVYKSEFSLTDEQLTYEEIEINFMGLDTYAEVHLNGQLILEADNMFRSWKVPAKRYLKSGENYLEVLFKSPLKVNHAKVKNYPYQLPSGCETGDLQVGSFTRKAAYHFGWDWGPRFVTAGVWRPIQINFWSAARIVDAHCQTSEIKGDSAFLIREVTIESIGNHEALTLELDEKKIPIKLTKGINTLIDTFVVKNPKLWWTNGLGDPHLYDLNISLYLNNVKIDSSQTKYGIRTIELVNEKDSVGTAFYFKLNGQPVFMKGANYIPQDMFLPRVTRERYEKLIRQTKEANMNMLRVWGGGIYENDIFYDLCDRNGILIWQDFMFAGSLYPKEASFINNVKIEVEEQVKRLRSHPCIAVWCGNNEIEVAWHNWGWQDQYHYSIHDSTEIWQTYKTIFHHIIPLAVQNYHPQSCYTSTSPLSNWGTPENFKHSSMHYWGVWHGKDNFEGFKANVGRFMVEYGFQSFPSLASLKTVAHDSSLHLDSEVMINRQKSYIGNGMITKHANHYFGQSKNFEDFIGKSQKTQALAYKTAIEAHLNNEPYCMGTLFWQLNDCWPGPSWSVIEYNGKEKEAFWVVKELYKK